MVWSGREARLDTRFQKLAELDDATPAHQTTFAAARTSVRGLEGWRPQDLWFAQILLGAVALRGSRGRKKRPRERLRVTKILMCFQQAKSFPL
jgi:hypothetical protein